VTPDPTVSICVPLYNGSAFLTETLRSVAAQTFQDYEVVIVDDNSTDDSVALVKQFMAADPRVKLFQPSQRAGSSGRSANRCIGHARGEWIKLIHQDDVMAPECVSELLDATRHGHRFALSWHDYHFEREVDAQARASYNDLATLRTVLPGAYAAPETFCEAVLAHWGMNFLGPPSSSFIHRECFVRYGIFSSEMRTISDLEYWIRVGSNEGVAIAQAYLVTYRVHSKSISAGFRNDRKAADYRNALERVLIDLAVAFAPEYAAMRAHMLASTVAIDARQMLTAHAWLARSHAFDAKYRNDDFSLLEQWLDFARKHPQIVALLCAGDRFEPGEQGPLRTLRSLLSLRRDHRTISRAKEAK
jgi:hypothetical protein